MNIKVLAQLFSLRDLRNAALGTVVLVGGIGLSLLTLYAHQNNNLTLAGISATASLVFVLLILIFVVPPLARNAGREASQMNLPFEITMGGAIMLVLIVIVGFSAWNTGNNLLFLVLAFLLAALIVSFFAGNICLKKLDVKMRFPETIVAGEPTRIFVSLTNRKRIFSSFSVVAEVRGHQRDRSVVADDLSAILPAWLAVRWGRPPIVRRTLSHFVQVGRGETSELSHEHIFPARGRFLIKDFELSTKFPFGFYRHRRRLPARETELIVLPPLEPFDHVATDTPLDTGRIEANKRGLGQDLLALRDYLPNDDLRRIDWKATARSRQLTVREFAAEDEVRVTVVLDNRLDTSTEGVPLRERISAEQSGKPVVASPHFEVGVGRAASVIAHFAERDAEIRLIIRDEAAEFGSGRAHVYDAMRRLAIVEPTTLTTREPETHLERILSERHDSHVFFVTANEGRGLSAETLQQLKIIGF
jgi:uncharacterized protein (DUF58 family)